VQNLKVDNTMSCSFEVVDWIGLDWIGLDWISIEDEDEVMKYVTI
jgi:hypothetical protein